MNKTYHHGDLPSALRAAAAELVAERGATGFSLREVARRAGVSHAAPAHHFGSSMGLLTSLAAEGFQQLTDAFDEALRASKDPVEQLSAIGKAYVNTALSYPGHFGVMCNQELVDVTDETFLVIASTAYERLLDVITAIRDTLNPELDVDAAATMAWSAVHGLASLTPNVDFIAEYRDAPPRAYDDLVERFAAMMIDGFAAR